MSSAFGLGDGDGGRDNGERGRRCHFHWDSLLSRYPFVCIVLLVRAGVD